MIFRLRNQRSDVRLVSGALHFTQFPRGIAPVFAPVEFGANPVQVGLTDYRIAVKDRSGLVPRQCHSLPLRKPVGAYEFPDSASAQVVEQPASEASFRACRLPGLPEFSDRLLIPQEYARPREIPSFRLLGIQQLEHLVCNWKRTTLVVLRRSGIQADFVFVKKHIAPFEIPNFGKSPSSQKGEPDDAGYSCWQNPTDSFHFNNREESLAHVVFPQLGDMWLGYDLPGYVAQRERPADCLQFPVDGAYRCFFSSASDDVAVNVACRYLSRPEVAEVRVHVKPKARFDVTDRSVIVGSVVGQHVGAKLVEAHAVNSGAYGNPSRQVAKAGLSDLSGRLGRDRRNRLVLPLSVESVVPDFEALLAASADPHDPLSHKRDIVSKTYVPKNYKSSTEAPTNGQVS